VPVYIAAITPKSIRQTGQIADGIFPIHWPQGLFGQLREDLAAGAKDAGRLDHEFTIAPFTKTTVLDGSSEDEAGWREARRLIQYYVNRMGVFYWQMLERNGFADEVAASRAAWANRDVEGSGCCRPPDPPFQGGSAISLAGDALELAALGFLATLEGFLDRGDEGACGLGGEFHGDAGAGA
jgi:alkanesulfonate monooxygenase SsuD/methylene tetrahydromethanopterin reductase-like flavin-dependent oxidoreductase (luciferase family)